MTQPPIVAQLIAEIENLQRLLIQAETRIEELEAEIETLTEQREEPYV